MTSNFRIWLLLFIALLSVSSSAIIVRYLSEIEAIPIAFARMTIAGIILWTYSLFKPQGSLPLKIKLLTILSGIFLGIHFAFFFSSVKLTTLANATLFGTLAPIFTVILNYLIYKVRINYKILYMNSDNVKILVLWVEFLFEKFKKYLDFYDFGYL